MCPVCHDHLVRELDMKHLGRLRVDYYRCQECGYVWTIPKKRQSSRFDLPQPARAR
jgi:uncharacterized Zn finger protein